MRTRLLSLAATLALAASAWLGVAPAHAAVTPPPHYSSLAVCHNMSHPMRAEYPCAGTAHSGVARAGTTPPFSCSSANHGVGPYAGNQSGNCLNGITYLQNFTNVPGYPSSTQVGTFWAHNPSQSSYAEEWDNTINQPTWYWNSTPIPPTYPNTNMQAMVEYFWCPAANSGQYPNGINYSYGVLQYSSGCGPIYVNNTEFLVTGGSNPDPNTRSVGDGEHTTYSSICAGNYVWDYSNPADGTYTWYADTDMKVTPDCSGGCGNAFYVNTPYYY